MGKYQCVEAEYEDIYNFEYLREQTPVPQRPGRTYTLNDRWEIEKPFRRPRIDSAFGLRLPSAAVVKISETGNPSGLPPLPPKRPRHAERAPVCAMQDGKVKRRFPTRAEVVPASVMEQQNRVQTPDIEFQGDFDPRTHPAVQAYERQLHLSKGRGAVLQSMETVEVPRVPTPVAGNGSRRILPQDVRHMDQEKFQGLGDMQPEFKLPPAGSVFAEKLRQYEESIRPKFTISANAEIEHTGYKIGDQFRPAPPTMPKPQNITSQRDFGCRRTRFQSSDVDLDISCRKRFPINNRLASQPPLEPEVNTDFDAEIAEAVRVEKEMAALNRHLAEKQTKMSEYFRDMEIQKPTTTAAANCNIPGCTTPSFIPPDAVPVKTREPVRVWDGNSAKSKLGFGSKFKKEEPERKTSLSVGTIPERIMKQIKKFFT